MRPQESSRRVNTRENRRRETVKMKIMKRGVIRKRQKMPKEMKTKNNNKRIKSMFLTGTRARATAAQARATIICKRLSAHSGSSE